MREFNKPQSRTLKQWFEFFKAKIFRPDIGSYGCPVCNEWGNRDLTLLKIENYTSSSYASREFGIDGHDWTEQHQCLKCGTIYEKDNADY